MKMRFEVRGWRFEVGDEKGQKMKFEVRGWRFEVGDEKGQKMKFEVRGWRWGMRRSNDNKKILCWVNGGQGVLFPTSCPLGHPP
jgi:hypothetical protein